MSSRDVYSKGSDALIARSQVISIHFQTVVAEKITGRKFLKRNNNGH
ncbi:hexameric tyrosine-coordinated heme protein [Rhodohalobacter sp.]